MDVLLNRRPIFDLDQHTVAYELLYRDGCDRAYGELDPNSSAGRVVLNALLVLDIEAAASGKTALVPVTRAALVGGFAALLPAPRVVLLVDGADLGDPEALEILPELKRSGYRIGLRVPPSGLAPAPPKWVDLVSLDLRTTPRAAREGLLRRFGDRPLGCIARGVDTWADLARARAAGFSSFQGRFYVEGVQPSPKSLASGAHGGGHPPPTLPGRTPQTGPARPDELGSPREDDLGVGPGDAPTRRQAHYLGILRDTCVTDLEENGLRRIIESDLALSARLLRRANRPGVPRAHRLRTVEELLSGVESEEARRWTAVAALGCLAADKPPELLHLAAVRASFCEALGPTLGLEPSGLSLFLLGLLSLVEAATDRPLSGALEAISPPPEVAAALLDGTDPLREALDLAVTYEIGDWEALDSVAAEHDLLGAELPDLHLDALRWAEELADDAGPASSRSVLPESEDERRAG